MFVTRCGVCSKVSSAATLTRAMPLAINSWSICDDGQLHAGHIRLEPGSYQRVLDACEEDRD